MESSPLLPRSNHSEKFNANNIFNELINLYHFAGPLTVATLLIGLIDTINTMYLGRVGDKELAAANLAITLMSTFCVLPISGFIGALDTLGAQAHGNPDTRDQLNNYFQRVFCIVTVMLIPAIVFLWSFDIILPFVFQDEKLNELTGLIGKYLTLTLIPLIYSQILRSYLVAQGLMYPWLLFSLCAVPALVLGLYFIHELIPLDNPFLAVPIAYSIAVTLGLIALIALGIRHGGFSRFQGFGREALEGWWPILKLGLWSAIMQGGEVWTLQIITIASGRFGSDMLAAQSVVTSILSLLNFVYTSLGAAATTRLGHLIGLKKSGQAKLSARIVLSTAFAIGCITWVLTQLFTKNFVSLFIPKSTLIDLTTSILSKVAIGQLLQSVSTASNGVLVGMGRQREGGIAQLVGSYLVAIPIGLTLAIGFQMETLGLLIGLISGYGAVGLSQAAYILTKDWDEEVVKCDAQAEDERALTQSP